MPKSATFPDSAYVVVDKKGHLTLAGKRVRYWGFIGWPLPQAVKKEPPSAERARAIDKAYRTVDLMVNRIHDLGFNLVRNWYAVNNPDYECGDGSYEDIVARYLWKLEQAGCTIWNSCVNMCGEARPEDADIIDDPATAAAWKAAVAEYMAKSGTTGMTLYCGHGSMPGAARAWDPRFKALAIARMKKAAQWPNKYKGGLRLCDDPHNIVWELSNEEIWYKGMFNGWWQDLPSFFRNELLGRWHDFLRDKYGSESGILGKWEFLLPGESLTDGAIMLAPLASPARVAQAVNDANPTAIKSLSVKKQEYTRDDFNRHRGEDVVEFFTMLWIEHKKLEADALKTWGKSCALSPCLWDAANCFQTQATLMFQHSDAVATCAYIQGMAHDPTYKRFPFYSGLEAPPRMCWDVPWMEQSSVKNKPHFVYEYQIGNRTKYRAEAATRVAAIGLIQDWDIINWHIYGHSADPDVKNPFDDRIHIWHDYFGYGNDEVQLSAMKAAGQMFINSAAAAAPRPTEFIIGRATLYDPASMDYGRSYGDYGKWIIPTCFRYGLRINVDLTREGDEIIGPYSKQGVYEPNPVRPNDQIEYDWNMGHLIFDSPSAASYTGFYGQRCGKPVDLPNSGVRISDVSVRNPRGIAFPVTPEEGYIAVTLVSCDGKPLAKTKKALLSAVSTSFNTDYKVDVTKSARGMHQDGPGPLPLHEFYGAWCETGKAPVLVARVGATVKCKGINGMKYRFLDWHMREIGGGVVKNGAIKIPSDKPVFITELGR
jgi:hypothetical protein